MNLNILFFDNKFTLIIKLIHIHLGVNVKRIYLLLLRFTAKIILIQTQWLIRSRVLVSRKLFANHPIQPQKVARPYTTKVVHSTATFAENIYRPNKTWRFTSTDTRVLNLLLVTTAQKDSGLHRAFPSIEKSRICPRLWAPSTTRWGTLINTAEGGYSKIFFVLFVSLSSEKCV